MRSILIIALALSLAGCDSSEPPAPVADGPDVKDPAQAVYEGDGFAGVTAEDRVTVRVVRASVERLAYVFKTLPEDEPVIFDTPDLAIVLEISNSSGGRLFDTHTARRDMLIRNTPGSLRDDIGNTYQHANSTSYRVPGFTDDSMRLRPGEQWKDLMAFEVPVDAAKTLYLELPMANYDGEGVIRLNIPMDRVERE